MNFGKTILDLRKKKNVTQEELAAELGVTAAAVSKWENGYTLPDILMLCALADYFAVTTDELLGRNKKRKYAVVTAQSLKLGQKIEELANRHGFTVVGQFGNYRDALSYTLEHENVTHIFIGLHETLEKAEVDATPSHIHSLQSIGNTDEDILGGFELIFQRFI